ncbi:MAG: Hsp20/alpha crystallin family protein [Hyphomicrobiaceae bacterium]|nr:Hsp20/alpha crystallin family protein [Hyphomicrobiaceae bacterium]
MPAPRYMMEPFQQIRRELDEVLERFMGEGFMPMPARRVETGMISPQFDVCTEGDTLRIEADLPGVDPEDVECTLLEGVLTVKGERREKRGEGEGGIVRERSFGRFERRFSLPEGIDEDSLEARFDKGVLTITAHMKPGIGQQRRIQIAGGTDDGRKAKAAAQQAQPEPQQGQAKQQGKPAEQGGSPGRGQPAGSQPQQGGSGQPKR